MIFLAIFESAILVSLASFYFSSGPLISKYSFNTPEILVTTLTGLSFLWALFVLKESLYFNNPNAEKMKFCFKSVISAPQKLLASWKRQYHQRCTLCLAIGALSLSNVLSLPVFNLITLYLLNSPFCFNATNNGYYLGTLLVTLSIGSALGVKLGLRFLPAPVVALISCICGSAYYFLLVTSKEKNILYAGISEILLYIIIKFFFTSIIQIINQYKYVVCLLLCICFYRLINMFVIMYMFL